MQKPKRRTYVIDLNGPAARGNLKLLALLYPAWGLLLPLYICLLGKPNLSLAGLSGPWQRAVLGLVYLSLTYFALSILTNRLVITGKKIRFGHNIFAGHKTKDLQGMILERSPVADRQTLIQFGFGLGGRKREVIETEGMEIRMKARLMAAIDNLAPQCQTPKAVRGLLMQTTKIESIKKTGETVTLPYHSRLLMLQVKEMVAQYQQYFWRVWAAFFTFFTVILAPIMICLLGDQIGTALYNCDLMFSTSLNINSWLELFNKCFGPLFERTSQSGQSISIYASQVPIASTLCWLALVVLAYSCIYMTRPNRLKIDAKGLTLTLEYFGFKVMEQFLDWSKLAAVDLIKIGKSSPATWKINLRSVNPAESMQLVFGALVGNAQKLEVVKALERYAEHIPVDPELLSALAPPGGNSFTELWLSSLASAPQREKLTPLRAGHTLKDGDYVVGARHGAGGQGVTYLAHRRSTSPQSNEVDDEAELVIKETILPIYVDSQNRRQSVKHFERDARLLLRLDHASLVKLRDYFIEDHRAYLVLDRVHGQNLRQVLEERGPLPPSMVLDLARQMCGMLIYLHEQDPEVIHRDFTPENLMLDQGGQLKLVDFGVAHEIKSRTTATVVGKHAYLPPEQFRGKPSTQSDLYALAATLYFLLTGSDPEPLSCLNPQEALTGQGNLSAVQQTIVIVLSRAIEHATELDQTRRTASARELLQELEAGDAIQCDTKQVEIVNG